MKLFVSYASNSTEDIAIAKWILDEAGTLGYDIYCQLTDDTVPPNLHEWLEERIKACEIFLAVWSESYLRGTHCQYERDVLLAIDPNGERKIMLGFRIDDVAIPYRFQRRPYIDARREGMQAAKENLVRILKNNIAATGGLPQSDDPYAGLPPVGQIAPQFSQFLQETSRLTKLERVPESSVDLSTLPVREPKFMMFQKGRSHVMAILDKDATVRASNLKRTSDKRAESIGRLASREILPALGFTTPFVHPMFWDPHDVLKTIFIDGNLFFQNLYFPHSKVKLPCLVDGKEQKIEVSISTFIATMRKFHGDKVIFASIIRKGWPDPILMEGLRRVHMLVRFAPTPTNTLHFGNVRTALVSYLMHRAKWQRSRFFLRFDDTNKYAHPGNWSDLIKQDLNWSGFLLNPKWEFSQTDSVRQPVYDAFFSLLQRFGYTKQLPNGEHWLNWESPELHFVHWLDWEDGPVIEHEVPKIVPVKTKKSGKTHPPEDPTGHGITNLALTTPGGDFLYKFCGTVDELLCTSHAVRDVRQIHLTRRQSLIRYAISLAWQEAVRTGLAEKERQLILAERERLVSVESSDETVSMPKPLLPFLSPPVFIHTAVVADQRGNPLKKREPRHKLYSILEGRENGTFLPETIVSYLVYTILSANNAKQRAPRKKDLAVLAAELGVEAFLDAIAIGFSPERLDRRKDQIRISRSDLEHQERFVLSRISYFHLRRHIKSFFLSNDNTEPQDELIEGIYRARRYFDKWTQIISVIRPPERKRCSEEIIEAVLAVARNANIGAMTPKAFNTQMIAALGLKEASPIRKDLCPQLRHSLIGTGSGPPISVLVQVLGLAETERRLRAR